MVDPALGNRLPAAAGIPVPAPWLVKRFAFGADDSLSYFLTGGGCCVGMLKMALTGGVTGREFGPLVGVRNTFGFDCCYLVKNGLLDVCLDMPTISGGSDA